MDRHGLLNILRSLSLSCHAVHESRVSTRPEWGWMHTPVVFPESRCVFCEDTIRSPGIWFLGGPLHKRLFGMLRIVPGGKAVLIQPSHPHDTGGGNLCLGKNPTGIDLLATPPNLNDCPMWSYNVPQWYKRYWDHDCGEMRDYLRNMGETEQLGRLDAL